MNDKFFDLSKKKQEKIINAALRLFSKNGYKNTSTEAITKEAEISKGLLFHYFESKKKLYLYLYEYSIRFVIEQMDKHDYKSKTDLFEFILYSQNIKSNIMKQYPYIFEFIVSMYSEEDSNVANDILNKQDHTLSDVWSSFMETMDTSKFKDPSDIETLIQIIMWASEGMMKNKLHRGILDIDQMQAEFVSFIAFLKKGYYKEEYL